MFEANESVIHGLLLRYYRYYRIEQKDGANAPPLLFLHGWRSEARVWQGICERLYARGRAMYALDLPGFGGSETPRTPYSLDDYARTVVGFSETLNMRDCIVVGHSFGGSVAIKLAAKHPELVKKLVLVSSSGIRKRTLRKRAIALAAHFVKPVFTPRFMQPLRQKLYALIGAEDYLATPLLTETFRKVTNEDVTLILPSIKQPTLIVWGDQDRATPLKDARIFERLIPNATLIVLKNAGHYSFLDAQDEWVQEANMFIDSV